MQRKQAAARQVDRLSQHSEVSTNDLGPKRSGCSFPPDNGINLSRKQRKAEAALQRLQGVAKAELAREAVEAKIQAVADRRLRRAQVNFGGSGQFWPLPRAVVWRVRWTIESAACLLFVGLLFMFAHEMREDCAGTFCEVTDFTFIFAVIFAAISAVGCCLVLTRCVFRRLSALEGGENGDGGAEERRDRVMAARRARKKKKRADANYGEDITNVLAYLWQ